MTDDNFFPNIITNLPHADIPIEGLSSYLIQCPDRQLIFMSFEKDAEVGEHSHAGQWAVVLDGQIELTVGGRKRVYAKGDTYFIPANVPHSARITAGYKDLTLFDRNADGQRCRISFSIYQTRCIDGSAIGYHHGETVNIIKRDSPGMTARSVMRETSGRIPGSDK